MVNKLASNDLNIDRQFFKRVSGILLLVIGIIWLDQFEGMLFSLAKIEFVVAGILWTKFPRISIGRSFRLQKEWRTGRDWAIAIIAGALIGTGITTFGTL